MAELARGISKASDEPWTPAAAAADRREARSTQRRFTVGLLTPILALLGIVAIAFAGARLPRAVRGPLQAAGITLPNQLRPGGFGGLVDRAIPRPGPGTVRIHVARRAAKRRGAAHKSPSKRGPSRAHGAPHKKGTSASAGRASGQPVSYARQSAPPAPSSPSPASSIPATSYGQPSPPSAPSGTAKIAPVPAPALPTRPGKGCGDKNHTHSRATECH